MSETPKCPKCGAQLWEASMLLHRQDSPLCYERQLAAKSAALEAAEARIKFLNNPGEEKDGYDCDHECRYLLDREDGEGDGYDDCQVCRAEKAESARDRWREQAEALAEVLWGLSRRQVRSVDEWRAFWVKVHKALAAFDAAKASIEGASVPAFPIAEADALAEAARNVGLWKIEPVGATGDQFRLGLGLLADALAAYERARKGART